MPLLLNLYELPVEILDIVACNFESLDTLLQLSLTCRRLYQYVNQNGFRTFVHTRFPFAKTSLHWPDTAKSLVALSKAWRQKAFIARELRPHQPGLEILRLSTGDSDVRSTGARSSTHQSIGYQPILQCLDHDTGNVEQSRKHVVAWGAGAELVLRTTNSESSQGEQGGGPRWTVWKDPRATDGKDDITSFNLFKSPETAQPGEHQIIIGRASGKLQYVNISEDSTFTQTFDTYGQDVRSTDITAKSDPLLAAGLDEHIAVYKALPRSDFQTPEAKVPIMEDGSGAPIWTVKCLNDTRIALGRGPAYTPLCIFEIEPTGIRSDPLLNFVSTQIDSVYSIEPLLEPTGPGHLFLAGWFSGSVTLHDLRCPGNIAVKYEDPIDPSAAIYSLCSFANDRFVAGAGRHSCVKLFDLRFSGRRISASKYLSEADTQKVTQEDCMGNGTEGGYNLFLNHNKATTQTSPVYSLVKASAYSTSFYAGLENRVLQLDLYSISDQSSRPQPRLPYASRLDEPRSGLDVEKGTVYLGLVEHTHAGAHSIYSQAPWSPNRVPLSGWDPCWVKGTYDPRSSSARGYNSWQRAREPRRRFRG